MPCQSVVCSLASGNRLGVSWLLACSSNLCQCPNASLFLAINLVDKTRLIAKSVDFELNVPWLHVLMAVGLVLRGRA